MQDRTAYCDKWAQEDVLDQLRGPAARRAGPFSMMTTDWTLRAKVFVQRLWQPTSACMMCMPGSLANVWSAAHWELALRTGVATGVLAVLLSFTPVARLYRNRYGNALMVGCLTVLGDSFSHPNHYGVPHAEAIVTGVISGSLALLGSYLLENRARRIRSAWARLFG
jgi:hypothetical protein